MFELKTATEDQPAPRVVLRSDPVSYPFKDMVPGQYFDVPVDMRGKVAAAAAYYRKKYGWGITLQTLKSDGKCRVHRVS